MSDDLKRLLSKLDASGGPLSCWPFLGAISSWGYGNFFLKGQVLGAHRVAYRLLVGPIEEGLQVDHLCHVAGECVGLPCPHRACCNPTHLTLATPRANTLRGNSPAAASALKTHCPNGHEFNEANTYHWPGRKDRGCRPCRTAAEARRRARRTRTKLTQGSANSTGRSTHGDAKVG